jgi:putative transposase
MAVETRRSRGCIHQSDRGVQYASTPYVALLRQYGLQISMSAKGNPYDNAFMESFYKTLKYEEVTRSDRRSQRLQQAEHELKHCGRQLSGSRG